MLGGVLRREERLIFSDEAMCGSSRGRRPPERGFFRLPLPPSSGTTGVTQEPRSCMPNSTTTRSPTRTISALERRERAAHRGDSDMIFFISFRSDIPCMCMCDLYYVVIANGEGWTRGPPRRKTLTLSLRWKYWVRLETTTNLSVLVAKKINAISTRRNPYVPSSRRGN
jgi:hypothetical protein